MSNSLAPIKNKKVRQSNNLIESPYAQEFSAHEIKIFEIAVASCIQEDIKLVDLKNDKEFAISNNELAKLLNTKPNVISMEIEKTAARIMKKTIHLRKVLDDGTIEFEMINIIPYAKYKDGIFKFRLNYSIIPYLTEINKNFTEYQLHYLLAITSASAIKLYKLLYQYKKFGKRTFSIIDLKEQFGLGEKYAQYKNFKQKVIEPSIKQINTFTDLIVSYEEEKIGRKVDKLEFKFKINKDKVFDDNLLLSEKIIDIEAISVNGGQELNRVDKIIANISSKISISTKKIIKDIYTTRGEDYLIASIEYAKENAKTNFDKYLKDTLENDWAVSKLNKIQEKKAVEVKNQILAETELEEKNKRKEQRKIKQDEIKTKFLALPLEERTIIFSELVSQISKGSPEKMVEVIASQEDFTISFWAIRNNINYSGALQLNLKSWLKLNY